MRLQKLAGTRWNAGLAGACHISPIPEPVEISDALPWGTSWNSSSRTPGVGASDAPWGRSRLSRGRRNGGHRGFLTKDSYEWQNFKEGNGK